MAKISISESFKNKDMKNMSAIHDFLMSKKLNYCEIYAVINKHCPMSMDEYEEIMYDLDMYESQREIM